MLPFEGSVRADKGCRTGQRGRPLVPPLGSVCWSVTFPAGVPGCRYVRRRSDHPRRQDGYRRLPTHRDRGPISIFPIPRWNRWAVPGLYLRTGESLPEGEGRHRPCDAVGFSKARGPQFQRRPWPIPPRSIGTNPLSTEWWDGFGPVVWWNCSVLPPNSNETKGYSLDFGESAKPEAGSQNWVSGKCRNVTTIGTAYRDQRRGTISWQQPRHPLGHDPATERRLG